MVPEQAPHLIDRAMRIALAEPHGHRDHRAQRRAGGALRGAAARARHRPLRRPATRRRGSSPPRTSCARAAEVLNAGEKVAMLVGAGALRRAATRSIEVADLLGAGVAKALNGRAAVPDDLPFVTGSIGLLGTKPSADMMEDCDTLLMVGTSFPYSEWLPEAGTGARACRSTSTARLVGIRYPMEVDLVGDAAETLRALLPLLERKDDRSWREEIEDGVARWWEILDERARRRAPTRSTRSSSSTSSRRGCPTARS